MEILKALLIAVSLCADCFAVSVCSGVTLRKISFRSIAFVALAFAVIQTGLLAAGWAFGALVAPLVHKISHWIGFLLLLYVGGGMVLEGIQGKGETRNLDGWKNVIIGGVATSIDALSVGAAFSMEGLDFPQMLPLIVSVFGVTALSVVLGLPSGKKVGSMLGRVAEIAGGIVLIVIGIFIVL